jgi:hypothetical protein
MATQDATEAQILDALHQLNPDRWREVLDFIAFLTHRTNTEELVLSGLVAMELLQGCRNRIEPQRVERRLRPYRLYWPSQACLPCNPTSDDNSLFSGVAVPRRLSQLPCV